MFPRHLSVAPMLDYTDRHCRYFHRLLSKKTVLYTEMITTGAILNGPKEALLTYDSQEHPVALQLGGSNSQALKECAKIGEDWGYDEINLNIGCPSNRVKTGRFGACLMAEPLLVAECIAAMEAAVRIPITIKTRIGIDNQDSYEALSAFINTAATAGCKIFIIHARKALLSGLSPKENREIPPLRYDIALKIKQDFPTLQIVLNGGITELKAATSHLKEFDGIMIGRAAYHNPLFLVELDRAVYKSPEPFNHHEVLLNYISYMEKHCKNTPINLLTRPLLGLFQGLSGARAWRRHLSGLDSKQLIEPRALINEAFKKINFTNTSNA